MAHEITGSDGMFTVRQSAWHGLGTVFEDYPSRAEAQALAHPWEPVGVPVFRAKEVVEEDGKVYEGYEQIEGFKANVRSDNDEVLGVVTEAYTPVLNTELWDVAEALQMSGTDVMYETAGSLQGGKKVWALVRLQEPIAIKGDPRGETIPYFALQNSHDGDGAFRGQATMTRIVCANTARIADMDAQARGTEFTFRHSKNVASRIEQARTALAGWRDSLTAWKAQNDQLISQKIEPLAAVDFLDRFIPMPPENLITERVRKNIESDRSKWLESYQGITGDGIKDTSYGLVQASVEFLNWHRKANNDETRFRRTFLTRDALVGHAVKLANDAYRDLGVSQGSVLA
jgi:phage/plasmid-like protein (TIGR03299 family)